MRGCWVGASSGRGRCPGPTWRERAVLSYIELRDWEAMERGQGWPRPGSPRRLSCALGAGAGGAPAATGSPAGGARAAERGWPGPPTAAAPRTWAASQLRESRSEPLFLHDESALLTRSWETETTSGSGRLYGAPEAPALQGVGAPRLAPVQRGPSRRLHRWHCPGLGIYWTHCLTGWTPSLCGASGRCPLPP